MKKVLMVVCLLFISYLSQAQLASVIFAASKDSVIKPSDIPKELTFKPTETFSECVRNERAKCLANPFCAAVYILCWYCEEGLFAAYCAGKTQDGGTTNKR